ncbi:bifunctional folylpolyglutamate synthase/dihydrofolate synthase [Candidatus Uzinura diaspidicola str. ASNER]|uniref:Dihydrofolate synthase/folylpolyglutamate synthase n=1 Tax=Candidatus Uzinura diaspidicola str. ASNER TaxID=1133592 RepID=L7VJE3_9FLAO|nr:bifunctional folylpolyglutamate synthase/dihydrofolate synthase [Candidatus Uzinura diaspidicola str. ASNER]
MRYEQNLQWLFDKLPIYNKIIKRSSKSRLDKIIKFCEALKSPEITFTSIHLTGTNGKGSTGHLIASILQEAGYRTGIFSSPHLVDFRERIKCNGNLISKEFITTFVESHRRMIEHYSLSFFEIITIMSFSFFYDKLVDIAIVETGLGGRLDSTNIIFPILSIITNVNFDHIDILGKTLRKISIEKAGIIKNRIPVIIGSFSYETISIFKKVSKEKCSSIYFIPYFFNKLLYESPLKADYQRYNQQIVLQTIKFLRTKLWKISSKNLLDGFKNIIFNTGFKGRWEILSRNPLIICDTAHNEDGISLIVEQLSKEPANSLRLVLGFVKGKDITKMLSYFPQYAIYYFCQPHLEKALSIETLKEITKNLFTKSSYFRSLTNAFSQAKQDADIKDVTFVGGSTFVVSEILVDGRLV